MEIISRHETEDEKGYANVVFNSEENVYEIKLYDNQNHLYYTNLRNKLNDAQSFADNWALGIEKFYQDSDRYK